jgi:hypothetical protein
MPAYQNSEQLTKCLQTLFERILDQGPEATRALSVSRMVLRFHCISPEAQITINGRKNPVDITYGAASLRPDLDIELTADALHQILLGELPLRKAAASGQMKMRGPITKVRALEDILHRMQSLYPQVIADLGIKS